MTWFNWLSQEKYAIYLRWISLGTQVAILILALVLVVNITTKQHNSTQVEAVKLELLEQLEKDKKAIDERIGFLKEELVTYQSTREGRAKLFNEQLVKLIKDNDEAHLRLNRRVDNLNSRLYYWTGKVKKSEIEDKVEKQ